METIKSDHKEETELRAPKSEAILRVVGGPAAGREFPIKNKKITVGRAVSADISVPDTVISRLHVAIFSDGKGWKITDLGSTNGTWVRGEKISGDTDLPLRTPVRIGNTLFEIYQNKIVDEPLSLDESLIAYRVNPITAESLILPAGPMEEQFRREQEKLKAIYQVQSLLTSVTDESELYHKILDVVDDVIPSDTSYLLSYLPNEENFEPMAGRNASGRVDLARENYVSRSIVNYVKTRNESILSIDAPNDERFHSHSLCGFNVQSVMCAPMLGKQNLRGLIYIAAKKSAKEYEEDDLRLLTMIAHSAGMAIENKLLIEENIRAERMAAIGVTAAGLSHYVKNILNGLEGSVSLLRLGIDTTDKTLMDDAWEILSKNHKRLSTLVLDLLNLAKEDSVDLGKYNIADIVLETVELVVASTRDDNITINTNEKLRGSELFAEVDSRGFHRVLLNLLNNAIDAVSERHGNSGDGLIEVDLQLEDNQNALVLRVKDNGVGIPREKLDKVFEMFHTGKGERGTGLGLAVSKRIIENHNGNITVDSTENLGTTFTIIIPSRHVDLS